VSEIEHCIRLDRPAYSGLVAKRLAGHAVPQLDLLVTNQTPAFRACYPYADKIVLDGTFRPPCGSAGCRPCKELGDALAHHGVQIPLALITRNCVEVYIKVQVAGSPNAKGLLTASRPLRLLWAGELFGVFESLDSICGLPGFQPPWSVTAGARSVILLTPGLPMRSLERWLKEAQRGKGLSTLAISEIVQRAPTDGWQLVKLLLKTVSVDQRPPDSRGDWTTEIVVFPHVSGSGSLAARSIPSLFSIAKIGWMQSRFLRSQFTEEENLTSAISKYTRTINRDERISLMGVLRQVLAMARGDLPAYVPTGAVPALPYDALRERLLTFPKKGHPLLLQPGHLKAPGDGAFVSLKLNFLPSLGSDKPRTFQEFREHIDFLLTKLPANVIDLERTKFIEPESAYQEIFGSTEEGLAPLVDTQLSVRHPFLTGCLRIVRN
jgi:hypothetical protein